MTPTKYGNWASSFCKMLLGAYPFHYLDVDCLLAVLGSPPFHYLPAHIDHPFAVLDLSSSFHYLLAALGKSVLLNLHLWTQVVAWEWRPSEGTVHPPHQSLKKSHMALMLDVGNLSLHV